MLLSVLLGIVQGLTEFLPVSSSGHLIVVSWLLNGQALPLATNTSLHFGTLIAVLIYFRNDWINMAGATFRRVRYQEKTFESSTLVPALILGSVPAGILGLLAKDLIEDLFHKPFLVAFPLALVGFLLWAFDRFSPVEGDLETLTLKKALYIGLAQTCALIPGVSRSGATITCARALRLNRQASARFSFLLGTPAMGGAALLHYKDFIASLNDPSFYTGIITSCVVGCLAIKLFLGYMKKFGFLPFAIYRAILAAIILSYYYCA